VFELLFMGEVVGTHERCFLSGAGKDVSSVENIKRASPLH